MTGAISRDPRPPPHIPPSPLAVRVMLPERLEKLIPIQEGFRALAQEPLFREASYSAKPVSKDHQAISWTVARIGALLGTIYNSHVTTLEDRAKVKNLIIEIKRLKKNLAAHDKTEQNYYNACFLLAKQALDELTHLRTSVERSYSTQDRWNQAINQLVDCALAPLFPGETLLGMPFIQQGIAAAERLQKKIDKLPEESAARTCLESIRDQLASDFLEGIKEWSERLEHTMEEERQFLLDSLNLEDSNKLAIDDLMRQLVAIRDQQEDLEQTISQLVNTNISQALALSPVFKDIVKKIQKEKRILDNELDNYKDPSSLPALKYGSDSWKELVAKRPQKEISLFDRFKEALTFSPETWSESKKTVVRTLLLGMRMTQRGIGIHAKYGQALTLQEKAQKMQAQVAPAIQQTINRDTGRLGILLSDKYASLLHHPKLIDKFSQGNEPLRHALMESLEKFSAHKPTREEVFQVMDAFKMSQYAAHQPSLFSHLSFGDWFALFTKEESPSIQKETQPLRDEVSLMQERAVVVRSDNSGLPWMQGMINSVGTMLGWVQEAQQVSGVSEFVSTKAEEGELQLHIALKSLSYQEERISQDRKNERARKLNQEIALLQRELTKTLQNKPEEHCLLSTLAIWMQEVSDKCYAVKLFEDELNLFNLGDIENSG